MRYFLDTEFIESPGTIDLISIGMVCEDGHEFYAESRETDWSKANPWVLENVKPHLIGPEKEYDNWHIAQLVREFADPASQPEFWGYYADYDWVVFCWLFGTMMQLPNGYPMYCRDIKQWADELGGIQLPKQEGTEHNALADARWNKIAWEFLEEQAGLTL